MSEQDRGPLLATFDDGTQIYRNGVLNSRGYFEVRVGVYNFSAEYNPNTGNWNANELASFGTSVGSAQINMNPNGDGLAVQVSGTVGIVDVGVFISENGDVFPVMGVGVGAGLFGVSAGYILADNGDNLSSYNTITVQPDGAVIKLEYLPGDGTDPFASVRARYTHYDENGQITASGFTGVDRATGADMAAGIYDRDFGQCFLENTLIAMWPSDEISACRSNKFSSENEIIRSYSQSPIQDLYINDLVVSFDSEGELRPGRVARIFKNRSKVILDFFGTFVTPAHVYRRIDADGAYAFQPLIDILRDDGVIQAIDGLEIRAATGICTNDPRDRFVWTIAGDGTPGGSGICVREKRQLRLGTRFITPDGRDFCIADLIEIAGGVVTDEGLVRLGDAEMPFHWSFSEQLPKPEDYILQRSGTTLVEIYRAAEWEGRRPSLPAPLMTGGVPVQPFTQSELADMPRNMPLALRGGAYAAAKRPMLAGRSTRNEGMGLRKSIEADRGKRH